MMKGRIKVLFIAIPVVLVIIVGVITTLSLPIFTLGPEKISLYDVNYESSNFELNSMKIKYYEPDELIVKFYIDATASGKNLRFEFVCRDENAQHIEATTNGNISIVVTGGPSYPLIDISSGEEVMGVLQWGMTLEKCKSQTVAAVSVRNTNISSRLVSRKFRLSL